jgi:hypothetical protein
MRPTERMVPFRMPYQRGYEGRGEGGTHFEMHCRKLKESVYNFESG